MSAAQALDAELLVRDYILANHEKTDPPLGDFDTYAVWYGYVLGNWKCLVSSTLPDGKYYEVTRRADSAVYLDVYVKVRNVEYPDQPETS